MKNIKSLIIGMGPGGLEQAIILADKLHNVRIVEKRNNPYARAQRTVLNTEYVFRLFCSLSDISSLCSISSASDAQGVEFRGLEKLSESHAVDYAFFKKIADDKSVIAINELQQYVFAKLQQKKLTLQDSLQSNVHADWRTKLALLQDQANPTILILLLEKIQEHCNRINNIQLADVFLELSSLVAKHNVVHDRKGHYSLYNMHQKLLASQLSMLIAKVNMEASMIPDIEKLMRGEKSDLEIVVNQCVDEFYQELLEYTQNCVQIMVNTLVDDINLENKTATQISYDNNQMVIAKENIAFDYIVCADGAARSALKNINGLNVEEVTLPLPRPEQKAYGIMRIKGKGDSALVHDNDRMIIAPLLSDSSVMSHKNLPDLMHAGWQAGYLPVLYVQYMRDENEFYVTGEFPNQFLDIADKAVLMRAMYNYAAKILQIEFPYLKDTDFDSNFISNDSSIFALNPSYVKLSLKDSVKPQQDLAKVFVIGDSYLQALFLYGNGIPNASYDAYCVGECFDYDGCLKTDLSVYTNNAQQRIDEFLQVTQKYKNFLYYNEHPLLLSAYKASHAAAKKVYAGASLAKSTLTWVYHNYINTPAPNAEQDSSNQASFANRPV